MLEVGIEGDNENRFITLILVSDFEASTNGFVLDSMDEISRNQSLLPVLAMSVFERQDFRCALEEHLTVLSFDITSPDSSSRTSAMWFSSM